MYFYASFPMTIEESSGSRVSVFLYPYRNEYADELRSSAMVRETAKHKH